MTKVLLIEDDDTLTYGIRIALEKKGYEIYELHQSCRCKASISRRIFFDSSGFKSSGWKWI